MAELTRADYLRLVARPKRRFQTLLAEGSTITLRDPIPSPCYWFERNDISQEHPSGRYLRIPSLGTISLVVDGRTAVLFYLKGRRLDSCTFAYNLTPAQLTTTLLVMKRAGLQRLVLPAAEWAIREMPDDCRPGLERALRSLVGSLRRKGRS